MPPPSPTTLLALITTTLTTLLSTIATTTHFPSRFRLLHSKLLLLSTSLSSLSNHSSHHHPLLVSSLPALLLTLRHLMDLSASASDSSFSGGKLRFQSDLDMATAALGDHIRDLELILRAGIPSSSSGAAIVVSRPGPEAEMEDLVFYVRDLFARLQIGGVGFKEEAIESLIQLLEEDERSAVIVAREGNVSYLIQLLDYGVSNLIREKAVAVIAVLAGASEVSRGAVFEEGGLGPLLRILDNGTLALKEKAAAAIEAITSDPENAWAVAAYGGVRILMDACRCGSPQIEACAVGVVRNVLVVEEMREAFVEETVIPVLIDGLVSGDGNVEEKAAECLSIVAGSNERFRSMIVQHRGLQRLLQLILDSSNLRSLEHALTAIRSLSISDPIAKFISSSTGFVLRLSDLILHGNVPVQLIAATMISSLPISDGNKRAMSSCMPALVKLIEMPKPGGIAAAASMALVSLLAVKSNRKELGRDEKSVRRLVQAMSVENESVCKEFPVAVVAAMVTGGGNDGCRRRLVAAGAMAAAQRLEAMEVAGARKAAARLAGNRLRNIFSRSWRE
ncbi:hypothetical protein Droror1_Dr00019429 [Drosera rotundifolia]